MGSDVPEVGHALQSLHIKVHSSICCELENVLDKISCLLPAIEIARPRCMSGIKEFCSLNNIIEKAKLLIQNCGESSKLYLAITGEATLLRCERIRTTLDQSLCQIQNMVPELLALQISDTVKYVRCAKFSIDSRVEEAGKAMLELLRQTESSEELEYEAFLVAALSLNITSPKALLIERRSIKKLLDKFQDADHKRKRILNYFLYLIKKYGKEVRLDERKKSLSGQCLFPSTISKSDARKFENNDEPNDDVGAQTYLSSILVPSEELGFQISSGLMYDPSVNSISSLKNVSAALLYGDTGNHLLQTDNSNTSFISSDASYCSDSFHLNNVESSEDIHGQMFFWSDDYKEFQSFSNFSYDMFLRFFYRLSELPVKLQHKAVDDVKILIQDDEETCYAMLSNGFAEALVMFLKNAKDLSNIQAQETGVEILLLFLNNSRFGIPVLNEGAFELLTSFLDSEIAKEALMIIQRLTHHPNFKSYIEASGVPPPLVKFLGSEDTESLEPAVKILYDLSSYSEIKPHISSSGCIQCLIPLLSQEKLSPFCIKIMSDLVDIEGAAGVIAETNGSLASVAELLETGSPIVQEQAVAILHSLCSHSFEYCHLVMKEGVIPSLVDISVNGSAEGKESSMKLLQLLREIRKSNGFASLQSKTRSTLESSEDFSGHSTKAKPTSRSAGFFTRKMRFFSKPRSLALF